MLYIVIPILIILMLVLVMYWLNGKPVVFENEVLIHRPQEIVFDFIADMRNELQWNPDVQKMELQTAEPIQSGSVFLAKWTMSGHIAVAITQYNRPNNVSFVNGGPLAVTLELKLATIHEQTQLKTKFIATPHGLLRVIFPFMKRKLGAQEQENMRNLKKALENTSEEL